jgi:hypothetical protein
MTFIMIGDPPRIKYFRRTSGASLQTHSEHGYPYLASEVALPEARKIIIRDFLYIDIR